LHNIDCHFHIFEPHTEEAYQSVAKKLGFEQGIVVQASTQGKNPTRLFQSIEKLGPNYRCVGEIDLRLQDKDLAQLAEKQMLGSRVNYRSGESFEWESIEKYARRIAPLGWHLDFYISALMTLAWAPKMGDLPVPVVLDHFGMLGPKDSPSLLLKLIDKGNCWVKLSAPYRVSQMPFPHVDIEPLAKLLINHAPERMLWGTDWPHMRVDGPMPNTANQFELFFKWAGPEAKRILKDNPTAFYGI